MAENELHSPADFARVLAAPRGLLFKHSPRCPVSLQALAEWQEFRRAEPAAATWFVDVIADREVARGLAAQCGVAHASPQAILFVAGRPAWQASHEAITAAALLQAWRRG